MSAVHVTVLCAEAVEALAIKSDGLYVDATFGRGGHSREILARLGASGRLLALDRDPEAVAAGHSLPDSRFVLLHRSFGEIDEALRVMGWDGLDGVLFDLGVSSPQLDEECRGFGFSWEEGPLDMRMDNTQGETAAEWLARADVREITEVIRNYGEERFAFQIAKKVVAARRQQPVVTTGQFATIVRSAVRTREPGKDPATRSFQAVRIHINQELDQLALALPKALDALKPGGRLVVISFHSLEDRLVKRFLQKQSVPDELPKTIPLRTCQLASARVRLVGKARRPGMDEISSNPRSRSAVMRVAEKIR